VHNAYIVEILCPQINEIGISPLKLSTLQQREIIQEIGLKSLRELAREYNVSYETVRRIIKRNEDLSATSRIAAVYQDDVVLDSFAGFGTT
jgi:orotate phosphoribosyltransferase-like protein